jgi:uncharacterized membrane protein
MIVLSGAANPCAAIKMSFIATNNNVIDLLILNIFNIGLVILSIIPLGLGLIWSIPYLFINRGVVYQKIGTAG